MLKSLLNSHPNIYLYGEIFRSLKFKDPQEIYDRVFSAKPFFIKVSGFKIFYYHPEDSNFELTWQRLFNDRNVKVIHLKRKNLLRTLVSRKLAEKNNEWKQNNIARQKLIKQVALNKTECKAFFERTKNWEKQFDEFFKNHQKIDIFYEDLVDPDHKQVLIDLQSFIGVKEKQLKTNLVKQNPEKLSELIINYNELKEDFANGSWASFFMK
jgi:LPS sulfotransferase NodH